MSISTVAQSVAGSLSSVLEQVKHFVGNLAGRSVTLVRNYPGLMQDNRAVAIATFIGVNIIVLKISNWAATKAENNVDNKLHEKLKANGETVKHVVVSLIVGSAAYAASAILSEVAEYPLTRGALLTISVFAVFARYVGKAWVETEKTRAEKQKQIEATNALKKKEQLEAQQKLEEEKRIAAEELAVQEEINALEDTDPTKATRQEALNKKKTDREEAKRQAEEQARLRAEAEKLAQERANTEAADKAAAEKKQKADDAKFKKVLEEVALQTKPLSKEDKASLEDYLALDMSKEIYSAKKGRKQDDVKQVKTNIEQTHTELKEAIVRHDEDSITRLTQNLIQQENDYNKAAGELIELMATKK